MAVSGAVIGLGTWATESQGHPTTTVWFKIAVGVAAVGLLLLLIGGVGAFVTRQFDITAAHASSLNGSLELIASCIEHDTLCNFGDDELHPRRGVAFRRHFRRLKLANRWDRPVGRYVDSVAALRKRLETEVQERGIGSPTYDAGYISAYVHDRTVAQARAGEMGANTQLIWRGSPTEGNISPQGEEEDRWIQVPVMAEGESWETWWERSEPLRRRVDDLKRDSKRWPEAHRVATDYAALEGVRHDLRIELEVIREQWPPAAAWGCPGC
jgi:hypothetical protein